MQKVNGFVSVVIWGFAYAPESMLYKYTNTHDRGPISTTCLKTIKYTPMFIHVYIQKYL